MGRVPTSNESASAEFLGGNAVVFGSNRAGGNAMGELWEAQRDPVTCLFTAPRVLTGLESAAGKANPWMRDDGLAIVYPVEGSTGASDLHIATRPAIDAAFIAPVELVQLNFGGVDDEPWVNDALDTVYFMSTRTGDAELYVATR